MSGMVLTASSRAILGPISKVLGIILDAIYNTVGLHNVVLSIVIMTVLIYMCLLPFTIKQQKYSKLSQVLQPEIQAIQAKYKGKKDQASMQAMQQETQLVYQKYGVSPAGSCLQMLIQFPIFFALYAVFYNIPAYVASIKDGFTGVVSEVTATSNYTTVLQALMDKYSISTYSSLNKGNVVEKLSGVTGTDLNNYIIDILYKLPSEGWDLLNSKEYFNGALSDKAINTTVDLLDKTNRFFGINISEKPWDIITTNITQRSADHWLLFVIIALLIPVCSYLSQVANIKMMPTANNTGNDQMAQQMKMMNTFMPLLSLFMCFTVPVGLGIYWVCSALVRVVQQFFINKHFSNLDLDELIKENQEKAKKQREKSGISEKQISNAAHIKTKSIQNKANVSVDVDIDLELDDKRANAKPGSLTSKANMVKNFNERNSRK